MTTQPVYRRKLYGAFRRTVTVFPFEPKVPQLAVGFPFLVRNIS